MGKILQSQDSSIIFEKNHPGCIWTILHHLHHRGRHRVMKTLPHKSHSDGGHAARSDLAANDVGEMQECSNAETDNFPVVENIKERTPVTKGSMKSRIKALITEEVSIRKKRHHRSSSYPRRTKFSRTNSIHHLEPSELNIGTEIAFNDDSPGLIYPENGNYSVSSAVDLFLPKAFEEVVTDNNRSDSCAAMLTMNYLKQNDVDEPSSETSVMDHTFLHEKLIYAIKPTKNASLQESKMFLAALDLLNMKEELFLNILQDPSSSLAQNLHGLRVFDSKVGLTKSVTLPVTGSTGRRAVRQSHLKHKHGSGCYAKGEEKSEVDSAAQKSTTYVSIEDMREHLMPSIADCREDRILGPCLARPENYINASPGSLHKMDRNENKLVIKRFKNLGEKIKHAIRESRKDRQRIIMDAVLHKIPYGCRLSEDEKIETVDFLPKDSATNKNSCASDQFVFAFNQGGLKCMRRASSFDESMDKYCRLYESSISRQAKYHISERLRLRTEKTPSPSGSAKKLLGRFVSLPDLRSCSYFQSEDSPDANSSGTPVRTVVDSCVSIGSGSRFSEQKPLDLDLDSENQTQLDAPTEHGNRENLEEVDNLGNVGESESDHEQKFGPIISPASELAKPSPISVFGSNFQEDTINTAKFSISKADPLANEEHEVSINYPTVSKSRNNMERSETAVEQFDSDFHHVQLDVDNKAEFTYVRDVLMLSGFSRTELLGTWHSADQPVAPSVFVDMEGRLFAKPECFGSEEGDNYNHLLLFDLINEVLLEIYERSFYYYPLCLTKCSHVRPMPVEHHVLEEVWTNISYYLRWRPEVDLLLDDTVSQDLAKNDGWMNLQFDAECLGLDLEDMIFDDLLEEVIWILDMSSL